MSTSSLTKATGLFTYQNLLDLPPGALLEATNVVIDRPGIIEPRRGFKDYGDAFPDINDRAKQLLVYKGRILRHYFDNTDDVNYLQFDSDGSGTFSSFSGTYDETETGLRIKGLEANGNFYFTTEDGIKKISALTASDFTTAANYITDAGGVNALDLKAVINYTTAGFFESDSVVAYRYLWGIRDNNNNLVRGSPSPSTAVFNTSMTLDAVVDLTITFPERINTTDYFYQVYRTAVIPDVTSSPSEEFYLVYEANVTDAEIAAGFVTFTDVTPEDFRAGGELLYTNPVSGEGIDQANNEPPVAKDIALFRGSTFYANTRTKHRLFLSLLSTTGFVSATSKFIISTGAITNEYFFRGAKNTSTVVTVADVAGSLNNKYFLINSANNERKYYVWFNVNAAGTDPAIAGRIGIEVAIATGAADTAVATALQTALDAVDDFVSTVLTATVTVTNANNGFSDEIEDGAAPTAFTFTTTVWGKGETVNGIITANTLANPTVITSEDHNLSSGDIITITGSNSTPTIDGTHTITRISRDTFSVPVNVTVAGTSGTWIESKNYVLLSALATTGQQVDETARSLVHMININDNEVVNGIYLSGPNDVPGEMLLDARTNEDVTFFLAVGQSAISDKFNPELPATHSITDLTETNPTVATSATHGLTNLDQIVIYGSDTTPTIDGVRIVTVINANTFSVPVNVTSDGTDTATFFTTTVASDNEVSPNRIYFSKYQQPEAVPLVNFIDVGPKDKAIKRILALRDSLFILKEDGVYRLSGIAAPNFSVALFDSSAKISAADSADILNNQIYGIFSTGVSQISDTGISVISKPIDDLINNASTPDHENFTTVTFGLAYETDDAFILWLPTDTNDTVATQCYRYNAFTNTWTQWLRTDICAVIGDDDKIYLGPSDRDGIQQERKTRTRRDFADRELDLDIPVNGVDGLTVLLSSTTDVDAGDILSQVQYLTISEFNRCLKQLDIDNSVNDSDYFSLLGATAGSNMRNQVNSLATKLDADTGVTDTNYSSTLVGTSTFVIIQSDFNLIVEKLNLDTGVFFTDYDTSVETKTYEMQITEVAFTGNEVTLRYVTPFIEGPVMVFKGIPTTVVYGPQHFGDPSIYKQVRGGSILFERNTFTTAILSFSSDLSSIFDPVPFENPGAGIWSLFLWGEQTWGGGGSGVPMRTLIPLQKQRCRYLNVKFEHNNAFEHYAIVGISFTPRAYTPEDRAFR